MDLEYGLTGSINSTHFGYKKILDLYRNCRIYRNRNIKLCFDSLKWIDANMCAVLRAILYKLRDENNVRFYADIEHANRFPILMANGFFRQNNGVALNTHSTGTEVKLREFDKSQDQEFCEYVENELLNHSGIVLNVDEREFIIDCLIELFGNFDLHTKNDYPLFICGQYYPKKNIFKCTIQDLGVGFLTPVIDKHPEINTYEEAIKWALVEGNTSKRDNLGGLGMEYLKKSMLSLGGRFEVISGDCYHICGYEYGKEVDIYKKIDCEYIGSTINLVFSR